MNLTRYIISKPPYAIRNIAKYYITKKMQEQQVLKFDIRNPDPVRQLWGRKEDASEHSSHDCIVEKLRNIQEKGNNHPRKAHIKAQRAMKQRRTKILRETDTIKLAKSRNRNRNNTSRAQEKRDRTQTKQNRKNWKQKKQGNMETRKQRNKDTRKQGNKKTMQQGNRETRKQNNTPKTNC